MTSVINRYYDPTTAQFVSTDPAVGWTNQPYGFCNDNPLNSTDPLGLYAAAVMGGGYQTVSQQAATINQVLEPQDGNIGSPSGTTAFADTATRSGKTYLVLILTPNVPGKLDGTQMRLVVLSGEGKTVGSSNSLQNAGALLVAGGAGIAALGSPLLNLSEGLGVTGGAIGASGAALMTTGDVVAVLGFGALTLGGTAVVAGVVVLRWSIW